MGPDAPKPLPTTYHEWLASTVDEQGFEIPHGMLLTADGGMTMVALAVPPTEAYKVMLGMFVRDNASEMIFALDRFARPGQGTTLGDLMAGFHLVRGHNPKPFVVEYQFEPRIVQPIDWDNAFWNAALSIELRNALSTHLGVSLDGTGPTGSRQPVSE